MQCNEFPPSQIYTGIAMQHNVAQERKGGSILPMIGAGTSSQTRVDCAWLLVAPNAHHGDYDGCGDGER